MPKTKLVLNMVCSDTNDGACAHQNMSKKNTYDIHVEILLPY